MFGISTSLGFVTLSTNIVPPNAIQNNNINPINELITLWFFINLTNLLSSFFLESFCIFSTSCVDILCVFAVGSKSASSTKSPDGFLSAIFKSCNSSVAVWYLSIGSFFNAFNIILFTASGKWGFNSIGGTGSSCICFNATDTGVSASNGTFPVTISYITTPNEYISDFASVNPPLACSGEK